MIMRFPIFYEKKVMQNCEKTCIIQIVGVTSSTKYLDNLGEVIAR